VRVCRLLLLTDMSKTGLFTAVIRVAYLAKDSAASELSNLALIEEFSNDRYKEPLRDGFSQLCGEMYIHLGCICIFMYVWMYVYTHPGLTTRWHEHDTMYY
jgi:hypothetical protein